MFAFQGTLSYTALRESSPHLYSWTLLFKTVKWKRSSVAYSTKKYLLGANWVLGTIPGSGGVRENKVKIAVLASPRVQPLLSTRLIDAPRGVQRDSLCQVAVTCSHGSHSVLSSPSVLVEITIHLFHGVPVGKCHPSFIERSTKGETPDSRCHWPQRACPGGL